MIGIDTNVLVRYVAQDDADQARRATALIDQLSDSRPGYVTCVVLAELYCVLRRAYRADQESILTVLRGLADAQEIIIEKSEPVRRALRRVSGGADFPDALIRELGVDAGCESTVTFDHTAAKRAGMQLLE